MDLSSPEACLASIIRKDSSLQLLHVDVVRVQGVLAGANDHPELFGVVQELCSSSSSWESRALGLLLLQRSLQYTYGLAQALDIIKILLVHEEARVRELANACLFMLASLRSSSNTSSAEELWEGIGFPLLEDVRKKMTRVADSQLEVYTNTQLALDDVTGWDTLETEVLALTQLLRAIGPAALGCFTEEVWCTLVDEASTHVNRYIRAVSFEFIDSVISTSRNAGESLGDNIQRIVTALSAGLVDDWNQVRFAAQKPTRTFLLYLEPAEREEYWPKLLPALCMSRYHPLEGIRAYAQSTWVMVMGESGKQVVASQAEQVAGFYRMMASSDDDMSRESACYAIGEYAMKLEPSCVSPYISSLLQSLIPCFDDINCGVQAAACVASGRIVRFHPDQARDFCENLREHWIQNLSNNVWSVREDAANAFGEAMKCVDTTIAQHFIQSARAFLASHLESAAREPASEKRPQRHQESACATHIHAHKQTMPCCGAFGKAQKFEVRQPYPWEISDGCVYLLRELFLAAPTDGEQFVRPLIELLSLNHFGDSVYLHITVWKQITVIAQAMSSKVLKRYLDSLWEPLFLHIQRIDVPARSIAATECAHALRFCVGAPIFEHRVAPEFRMVVMEAAAQRPFKMSAQLPAAMLLL